MNSPDATNMLDMLNSIDWYCEIQLECIPPIDAFWVKFKDGSSKTICWDAQTAQTVRTVIPHKYLHIDTVLHNVGDAQ